MKPDTHPEYHTVKVIMKDGYAPLLTNLNGYLGQEEGVTLPPTSTRSRKLPDRRPAALMDRAGGSPPRRGCASLGLKKKYAPTPRAAKPRPERGFVVGA
jgi:hypothetical protein